MEATTAKTRQILKVDIGKLKPAWQSYCAQNQVSPSQAIREVIGKLTGQGRAVPPPPAVEIPGQRDPDHTARKTVRLTASEAKKLEVLAEASGYSSSKWITAMIRGHLTRGPQLGQQELEKLGQSNYQLVALGRNLNQIAKALNTKPEDTKVYRLDLIQALEQEIKQHVQQVSAVLLGNAERWQLK